MTHGGRGCIAARVVVDVAAVRTGNEGLTSMWAVTAAGVGGCEITDVEAARAARGAAGKGREAADVGAVQATSEAVAKDYEAVEMKAAETADGDVVRGCKAAGWESWRRISSRASVDWMASRLFLTS